MRRWTVLPLLLLPLSCSSLADSPWSTDPLADLHFQVSWHQDQQSEIVKCHYFKATNDRTVEIERLTVDFPTGSHHVHLYRSEIPEPDGVQDCTAGIDWNRWSLLVGVQTKPLDWQLPAGVTVPIHPHQQFLVQVHWLNTTDQPIDRTIDINFHPTARSMVHLGTAFGIAKDVRLAPGHQKQMAGWFPMPAGAQMIALMGHFHGRGRHYAVDIRKFGQNTPGPLIYEAQDEQTFEFKRYTDGPVLTPGDGLTFECDYFNDTDVTLTWGPDTKRQEHCNVAAYYIPAPEPRLSDLFLTGDVAAIELPPPVPAGMTEMGTVRLNVPAGPLGVDVDVESEDPSLLQVPLPGGIVHVPAWSDNVSFPVRGMLPARGVGVRATTGAGWAEGHLGVAGLELSEVYYKPASPTDPQWVEIANVGAIPIDLSKYSLGAGEIDYTKTRVRLGTTMLPPLGCMVVPGSALQPPLGFGLEVGNGVALFDQPPANITADTIPFDALVYGPNNANGLLGPDGLPARAVPGTAIGDSLERDPTGWHEQAHPVAGICRVTNAR
ncbi:MAG TPA: hypothetical protein VKN99_24365 [Polyangia bacterium]|nr:hypothetical protein [Polyangia bacterium]